MLIMQRFADFFAEIKLPHFGPCDVRYCCFPYNLTRFIINSHFLLAIMRCVLAYFIRCTRVRVRRSLSELTMTSSWTRRSRDPMTSLTSRPFARPRWCPCRWCLPRESDSSSPRRSPASWCTFTHSIAHTHTHNHFTALLEYVRDHPGEQVPER